MAPEPPEPWSNCLSHAGQAGLARLGYRVGDSRERLKVLCAPQDALNGASGAARQQGAAGEPLQTKESLVVAFREAAGCGCCWLPGPWGANGRDWWGG